MKLCPLAGLALSLAGIITTAAAAPSQCSPGYQDSTCLAPLAHAAEAAPTCPNGYKETTAPTWDGAGWTAPGCTSAAPPAPPSLGACPMNGAWVLLGNGAAGWGNFVSRVCMVPTTRELVFGWTWQGSRWTYYQTNLTAGAAGTNSSGTFGSASNYQSDPSQEVTSVTQSCTASSCSVSYSNSHGSNSLVGINSPITFSAQ